MNIEIENLSEDKLHKEIWSFWLCVGVGNCEKAILYLDSYRELKKETARKHNWEIIRQYQRLSNRYTDKIDISEVPFDEVIKMAVKYKLDKLTEVKLWDKK